MQATANSNSCPTPKLNNHDLHFADLPKKISMSIYDDFGFSDNPFQTVSLAATKEGKHLLVGRDSELELLRKRILNPPKIATIEGLNGVGKTSLVNVASYDCFQSFLENHDNPLLFPCRKTFQLRPDSETQEFIDDVLREVAQTLIEKTKLLGSRVGSMPARIDRWLNSDAYRSFEGGGYGISVGFGSEPNTGDGFARSGFRKAVTDWLKVLFPTRRDGGVICCIDNLELLQTSEFARKQLELLRDELLTVNGLRWVLCGALGIVMGVASSPRLEGFLHTPVEIGGVADEFVSQIYESRISTYAYKNTSQLPINSADFLRLYEILSRNIRSLLAHADDYCQWVADRTLPKTDAERNAMFESWLNEKSQGYLDSVDRELRPRAWDVFDKSIQFNGIFSPSDYEFFGFNSIPAFRPAVRDLENVGLVVSTQDDGDKRRKTIQVTPKGWLVNLARNSGKTKRNNPMDRSGGSVAS